MASLDSLPADQRAVLQLLLKQGKSYDDLSGLLRIDPAAVRDRAHAGLAALGPEGAGLPADRRAEISDYLLSQQSASARAATREYLGGSAAGRAWARTTAAQLRPLAGDSLPDVPAEGTEVAEAFDALEARTARRQEVQRSSRRGGLILLAGLGVLLAVGLILLIGGGDDDDAGPASGARTQTAGEPQILAQINLCPTRGGTCADADTLGAALVVRQGGTLGLALNARGLQASTENAAYGVWLYNSPSDARFLGFPQVAVGEDGQLQSVSQLEQPIEGFDELLLTRETQENPQRPGDIVLRGPINAREEAAGGAQGGGAQQGGQGTATAPAP